MYAIIIQSQKDSVKEGIVVEGEKSRRDRGQDTERKILDTALRLMREREYDQVSVRDICREAGITTGAFYHHFPSKDDMLRLGFGPLDTFVEESMEDYLDEPPLERLARVAELYARFMQEKAGRLAVRYYQHRLASGSAGQDSAGRYTYQAILSCLRDAKDQGLLAVAYQPEEVADYCMLHFRGIVIDWLLHDCGYDLTEKFRRSYFLSRQIFQSGDWWREGNTPPLTE